jgi:hypothetical protein
MTGGLRATMRRKVTVLVLWLSVAAVLAVGGWTLSLTSALTDKPCNDAQTFPGLVVVVVSIACFALGHAAGRLRADPRDDPDSEPGPALHLPSRIARHSRLVGRVAVALFLFVALLVLVYETIGLTNAWGTRPITSYVRCGASRSPWLATLMAGIISMLVGHWLWYPRRRPR